MTTLITSFTNSVSGMVAPNFQNVDGKGIAQGPPWERESQASLSCYKQMTCLSCLSPTEILVVVDLFEFSVLWGLHPFIVSQMNILRRGSSLV